MLTKAEIKKNRLDLSYQKQLQKYNALLIFISTGVLGFVGGVIANPSYLLAILLSSAIIIIFGLVYYFIEMKPKMKEVLDELIKLENEAKK